MNQRGFSLIEMLLSVTIISMLVGLSLPIYQSYQTRNDLVVTTEGIASMLRRAQTYAQGMNGNSQWGVHVQSGSAVLFKGTSYAAPRDTAFDESLSIPTTFTISGLSDIVFSKLYALPSATGSITLTNSTNNETRTVTINGKGMVSY